MIELGQIKRIVKNNAIAEMIYSPYEFFLTGSRHFGGVTSASDYDFYTQDRIAVRQWLESIGFVLQRHEYMDSNTAAVYYNAVWNVHVQLYADVCHKHRAQVWIENIISKGFSMPMKHQKAARKCMWDAAFEETR